MPKMPRALTPAPVLAVPTLVLHGGPTPATARHVREDAYFSGRYHAAWTAFPQREAPQAVARPS